MTTFDVAVFRFTPHLDRQRQLLETVGLRTALESVRGTYVELVGARGRVHLHHAEAAETQLNLYCGSIADAEADLSARGVGVRSWDEAFGHLMQVPGPQGSWVEVVEAQADPHGYRVLDAAGARGDVAAVWYTHDAAADVDAFATYGFEPTGPVDEWWTELRAADGSGAIGLHKADESAPGSAKGGGCELTITVDEDLDALEARLQAAGWETTRFADEHISYVGVVDPDGVALQFHGPTPA